MKSIWEIVYHRKYNKSRTYVLERFIGENTKGDTERIFNRVYPNYIIVDMIKVGYD